MENELNGTISTEDFYKYKAFGCEFVLPSRYKILKPIGCGAFGAVIAAFDLKKNKEVAIKKIPNILMELKQAKRVVSEIKILDFLDHENVILLTDILVPQKNPSDIYIITELMDCDLHRLIGSNQALTNYHIQYITYQILRGIFYIHSSDIIHRDLKPGNILLNKNCDTKIADFGYARDFSESNLTTYVQTRWYRAPELLFDQKKYNTSIDMWSFGCILAEMITKKVLFKGSNQIDQILKIVEILGCPSGDDLDSIENPEIKSILTNFKEYKPKNFGEIFAISDENVIDLLSKLLVFNSEKRLTAEQCLLHPYYKEIHNSCPEPKKALNKYGWSWDNIEATNETVMEQIVQLSVKYCSQK